MSEPTRLISAPWATVPDLPAGRPALPDDTWDELLWQASETLYALSGRQYPGAARSHVVIDSPPGAGEDAARAAWRPAGFIPPGWWSGARWCRWAGPTVVVLPDPPVTGVDSVLIAGVPAAFVLRPGGLLERPDGHAWPTDGSVEVTYSHGIGPPIGGRRAAVALAVELGRASAGGKCALPRRSLESIQREGITISMVNNAAMIKEGFTGLFEVDSWLREVNKDKLTRRASVWSPDSPRTRRTTL